LGASALAGGQKRDFAVDDLREILRCAEYEFDRLKGTHLEITAAEALRIRKAAREAGLSVETWVRQTIVAAAGK
jgi:hypothetical protein